MAFKPNFTALELDGNVVNARGLSDADDPQDLADIVDIQVVLVQGDRVARAGVEEIVSDWVAPIPVSDPEGDGEDFRADDAVVIGIQTHIEHATTITWAQPIKIVEV